MRKEHLMHITSNEKYQVWLHRTSRESVPSILENGLLFGAGNLRSTASLQPEDEALAERYYNESHRQNTAVVVIKIPKNLSSRRAEQYESDPRLTFFRDGQFTLRREHIHGWFDKSTGEYNENPHREIQQSLGEEYFPSSIYGDYREHSSAPLTNPKKSRKHPKTLLPSPPDEIQL